MNFKKFISSVSAFAIAASAFAAMAVTANAALSESTTVKGYVAKAYYNFTSNDSGLLPTEGDLRYRDGYGLHNYGSGTRSATVSISVADGDIVLVEPYTTSGTTTLSSSLYKVNNTVANDTLSTTEYYVFNISADSDTVTFTDERNASIKSVLVMNVDPDAPAETLTVNYKFGDEIVFSDTSIDIAGKHVGDTMTVPFRAYVEKDGAIYSTTKNGTNPHYGDSVTLAADTVVTKAVSKVDIEGTVEFFEDLDDGIANNADIRASYMSAYDNKSYTSAADLPAGVYTFIISGMNKGRGSSVAVGDTTVAGVADIANKNAWGTATITDVTVSEAGKLTLVAGSSKTIDDYDVIIAIKTADLAPATPSAEVTNTAATTYSGAEYDGEATSALVTVNYANMLADNVITLTYGEATKDVTGATGFTGDGNIVVGVVIQDVADANPVFTAGVR